MRGGVTAPDRQSKLSSNNLLETNHCDSIHQNWQKSPQGPMYLICTLSLAHVPSANMKGTGVYDLHRNQSPGVDRLKVAESINPCMSHILCQKYVDNVCIYIHIQPFLSKETLFRLGLDLLSSGWATVLAFVELKTVYKTCICLIFPTRWKNKQTELFQICIKVWLLPRLHG